MILADYPVLPAASPDEGVPWIFRYGEQPSAFNGPHYVYENDAWIKKEEDTLPDNPGDVEWWNIIPVLQVDLLGDIQTKFDELHTANAMIQTDDILGEQFHWRNNTPRTIMEQIMQSSTPLDLPQIVVPFMFSRIPALLDKNPYGAQCAALLKLIIYAPRYAYQMYRIPSAWNSSSSSEPTETELMKSVVSLFDALALRRLKNVVPVGTEPFTRGPSVWETISDAVDEFEKLASLVREDADAEYHDTLADLAADALKGAGLKYQQISYFSPGGPRLPVVDVGQTVDGNRCMGYGELETVGSHSSVRFYMTAEVPTLHNIFFAFDFAKDMTLFRDNETLLETGNVVRSLVQDGVFVVSAVQQTEATLAWATGTATYDRLLLEKLDQSTPVQDVPLVEPKPTYFRRDHTVAVTNALEESINGHMLSQKEVFGGYAVSLVRTANDIFWVPNPLLTPMANEELYEYVPPPQAGQAGQAEEPKNLTELSTNGIAAVTIGLFIVLLMVD